MVQNSSFAQDYSITTAITGGTTPNSDNIVRATGIARVDPSYLGDTFSITIAVTTFLFCAVTTVLNLGIMTYYWPKVKNMIGFIYFILSSSDFATGLCAGLHTLIFITLLSLNKSDGQSTSYIFLLIVPSYFLSVVAFKVSAYVSMVFAVIRTIRIISPLSSVINRGTVIISYFLWMGFWVAVSLIEMGFFIKQAKGDIEEMTKNVLLGHFYQPNKPKFVQSLFQNHDDGYVDGNDDGEMSKGQGVPAECVIDLLYTALPVFLCAGITVVATIIQVIVLMNRQSTSSDPEADRRDRAQVSITIILIGVAFIVCSSCTLYQPLTVCSSEDLGAGVDRSTLYMMGYMPFFLNAAVNPTILILRVAQLKAHMLDAVFKGRGGSDRSHMIGPSDSKTATTGTRHFRMLRGLMKK